MTDEEKRLRELLTKESVDAFREYVIEECAHVVDTWRRGWGLKSLAEKIRALK